MQIAIVSTDGKQVNDHFGKASRFLIYEAGPDGLSKTGEQQAPPLSTGDKSHPFDPDRFGEVAAALKGCERVYCTRIGDRPKEELGKLGITAVVYDGKISDIRVA